MQSIELRAILHWGFLERDPWRPAVQTERVCAGGAFLRTPHINFFWAARHSTGTPPVRPFRANVWTRGVGPLGALAVWPFITNVWTGEVGHLGDSCRPVVQSECVDGGVPFTYWGLVFCSAFRLGPYGSYGPCRGEPSLYLKVLEGSALASCSG